MNKIDVEILTIDKAICSNIAKFGFSERGLLSQNILSHLRNFVEHISLKVYSNGQDIDNTYKNIQDANIYVTRRGNLKFLCSFHKLLQIVASHYTLDEENSERLMLKYYEYLLKIKTFLKNKYDFDVLNNLDKFPISTDSSLQEYYKKIAIKIDQSRITEISNIKNDRYYIRKIKPFFVGCNVYYEVTFTTVNNKLNKSERIIAFTKLDISHNYAVKFSIKNSNINILGKSMPIQIIDDWEVSIRQCELNNFAKIFGNHSEIQNNSIEYCELMTFLSKTGLNLVELIDFTDDDYLKRKDRITQKAKNSNIFDILDKCRELVKGNFPGSRVIRYLLYRLNNRIIKQQYKPESCDKLSKLNLEYGCIPFDQMPYNNSLIGHNPKLLDLFDCIDSDGREHELFARYIKNNTEKNGQLYTALKDISEFSDVDELVQKYNSRLYYKHANRKLENYNKHIYIKSYEDDTMFIINELKKLSSVGVENYTHSVNFWLESSVYNIDCDEKRNILRQMFGESRVALIYGSAGTGKSTIINHLSHFFNEKKKLYLAKTNPAIDNLRRKVIAANCTFRTINKFLSNATNGNEFDLLIIDECSTVSNSDMRSILKNATFKLLVLVGDIFQIESIIFGNWFSIAQSFIPKTSIFELTKPYRSNNTELLELWNKVRNINVDNNILEHITKNKYSITLNESIFEHSVEDEIILCLNYDGLYGINNINRFLQNDNKDISVDFGAQTYKVNDPILFNESERFTPLIYNNLKGRIVGIEDFNDKIQFDIELDKVINQFDADGYDFQLMPNSDNGKSIIRFFVNKHRSTDDDDDDTSNTIVPFQIAYAISIHKAQGLEYNSVKVVITDEIEEMITHNIFYTAITRAKERLKIYWTPEVGNNILNSLKIKECKKDVAFLSMKLNDDKREIV
jgi:energy-coupling factor transporter ATP-binding protein EcfA2